MKQKTPIPGWYLLKLLLEVLMFCIFSFIYYLLHEWLEELRIIGPVIAALLKFMIFFFGASFVVRLLSMVYRRSRHLPYHKKDNVTIGLSNLTYLIMFGYAVLSIFSLMGMPPARMFTSLSIVAAAIAILSKDFIADVISGMIISFSSEISIDDYVKFGEHRGKIIDINISKVALLNEDDDIIFIPNNKFFSSEIINYTKKHIKKTSIEFEVPTTRLKSIEAIENQLIQSLEPHHELIEPDSWNLRVIHIRKDYVVLKFQYSLVRFDRELERKIKREAIRKVVKYLASAEAEKLKE